MCNHSSIFYSLPPQPDTEKPRHTYFIQLFAPTLTSFISLLKSHLSPSICNIMYSSPKISRSKNFSDGFLPLVSGGVILRKLWQPPASHITTWIYVDIVALYGSKKAYSNILQGIYRYSSMVLQPILARGHIAPAVWHGIYRYGSRVWQEGRQGSSSKRAYFTGYTYIAGYSGQQQQQQQEGIQHHITGDIYRYGRVWHSQQQQQEGIQ